MAKNRQSRKAISPAKKPENTVKQWQKPISPQADRSFIYEILEDGKPTPLARVAKRDDGNGGAA